MEVAAPDRPSPAAPDWQSVSAHGFGDVARELSRAWAGTGLDAATLATLTSALNGEAEVAARAGVLLGASRAPEARMALLARLETRTAAATRSDIGVDVIAARVLRDGLSREESARLVALSQGAAPHPDLAVRVECARTALLAKGDRAVVPFLLSVLRAETPAQEKSPITWPRITTLAWVKTRAAEALSQAATAELRFRPDGSWAHQAAEAARLESLLAQ